MGMSSVMEVEAVEGVVVVLVTWFGVEEGSGVVGLM